ncbi:MAG: hypothetical protein MJ066_02050 [Clostridia bacterium]|nr:hypothetical protein [Clostridia bacterium]
MKNYKRFKFVFTPIIFTLILIVNALLIAGIILNVINLTNFDQLSRIIPCYIFIVLSAVLIILSISALIKRNYFLTSEYIVLRLGLIKLKTKLTEVIEIKKFKNALVIYLKNEKYFLVLISESDYNDFIAEIIKNNGNINYTQAIEN